MRKTNSPLSLWDYCCNFVARIKNLTANNYYAAHGRTPMEILTGDTPDISEYMSFQWYQPVWYLDGDSFPNDKKKLGHWLGVSHRVGQAMCFWILTENVTIISRTSVQAVTRDELNSTVICDNYMIWIRGLKAKLEIAYQILTYLCQLTNDTPLTKMMKNVMKHIKRSWRRKRMIIYLTLTMTNYCLPKYLYHLMTII